MRGLTIVVAGHGHTDEERGETTVATHADSLRSAASVEQVAAGYVYGTPTIEAAITSCRQDAIVVPLFVSNGYYTREVIPERLAEVTPRAEAVTYTPPVGTHQDFTRAIERQAATAGDEEPCRTGLALVGHGSTRHETSDASLRAHAERIRARSAYSSVRTFFLDEPPRVDSLRGAFEEGHVVVVPVFMSAGAHVRRDIPRRIGLDTDAPAGTGDDRLTYTGPVGRRSELREIVLDRAGTARSGGECRTIESAQTIDS